MIGKGRKKEQKMNLKIEKSTLVYLNITDSQKDIQTDINIVAFY